ncbi:MAG TPA: class D sortase [Myxococcaceae bacterium]
MRAEVTSEGRNAWRPRLQLLERLAWALAVVLGGAWLTARSVAWISERRSLDAFRAAVSAPGVAPSTEVLAAAPTGIDQRLWAPERIRAYARALARPGPPPLAVLRIPRLGLEVPVLEGTGEWTLDRAVGHIEGTAGPGDDGNVGIAGHRDGFFRVLKDIAPGDLMELALVGKVRHFRVERLSIVEPDDTWVLAPSVRPQLTLVTCHPFYFVGSAPRRFIVHAAAE